MKDYIYDVIRFWVAEFDIDGIRLDAADVLDFGFMKGLRWVANEVKPDFWLMGEVIHGDYSRWANDEMLHSVTNYDLHKGLYSGHNDHNYFEIAHTRNTEAALAFAEEVKEEFGIDHVDISPLSLSIATHIGPGSLAVAISAKVPELRE